MELKEIYRPIAKDLAGVEKVLRRVVKNAECGAISEITEYLLEAKGKRLRPAMAILSAKAVNQSPGENDRLIDIATAVELIHMASLVHDDVIDRAGTRYKKPTVNSKWGQETSIALGDYLYSIAFELVSECGNPDIVRCLSSATKAMCEGEFIQVSERDNMEILNEKYIVVIKKKTAALFAASCQAGTLVSGRKTSSAEALREYGMNFGVAFQMVDDYLDLMGSKEDLGKEPGQDIATGEITLPVLNLLGSVSPEEREKWKRVLSSKKSEELFRGIRTRMVSSGAVSRTKETVLAFVDSAKENIAVLAYSPYKDSLYGLADFIVERGFGG